ncbi:hypothetical protein [Flagellimonas eckloniae]|uniref:Lipoprotein n=1 Tax=Flagellimonas eckloniae TaxID=346185 RepID=A0A0Q1C1W5_9FLAO|nr:hypothetical protein [Allomuricauda eckloniae]KQC31228.1 hypothetical protein AAY42_16040 [Allomuricauda eckloniae]
MRIKFIFVSLVFLSLVASCIKTEKPCHKADTIGIQFTPPFDFTKSDTLQIDDLKFTHVNNIDSFQLGNYLPNKTMVFFELEGKQAKENSNQITIGTALGRKLTKSGQYNILNGAELLTTGKLRISRKDGKNIKICFPPNYQAILLD